jgi:uncharacterized phage-associated protein
MSFTPVQYFTKDELDKLGNAIIFLIENVGTLSKTKLLKLVYLLDEVSVRRHGIPFFTHNYKLWQLGPVNPELFFALSNEGSTLLSEYVSPSESNYLTPNHGFEDDEFSQNEIEILYWVAEKFGSKSGTELIEYCHRPQTPWFKIATEHGLMEKFAKKEVNVTDIGIDLQEYLDEERKIIFKDFMSFIESSRELKS